LQKRKDTKKVTQHRCCVDWEFRKSWDWLESSMFLVAKREEKLILIKYIKTVNMRG